MTAHEGFGEGHLNFEGIDLSRTTRQEQAEYFGSNVGCPVVPTLLEKRGAEALAHRYANVLLYYGAVRELTEKIRPDIAVQITQPIKRREGEPLAVFDESWVPEEVKTTIPPTETPWGYALPRLIAAYSAGIPDHALGMGKAFDLYEETLRKLGPQDSADTLLVTFAERLMTAGGMDPYVALKNTISQEKLAQDSLYTHFGRIVEEMEKKAPTLWGLYDKLTPKERNELKIADVRSANTST